MKLMTVAALAAMLPVAAAAQSQVRVVNIPPDADSASCTAGLCINDLALTSDRYTGWFMIEGFAKATLGITYADPNDVVTQVQVTCRTSEQMRGANGSGYQICAGTTSGAAITMYCPASWQYTTGTSGSYQLTVDNLNARYLNCMVHGTGSPDAASKVTVRVLRRAP